MIYDGSIRKSGFGSVNVEEFEAHELMAMPRPITHTAYSNQTVCLCMRNTNDHISAISYDISSQPSLMSLNAFIVIIIIIIIIIIIQGIPVTFNQPTKPSLTCINYECAHD